MAWFARRILFSIQFKKHTFESYVAKVTEENVQKSKI